MLLNSTHQDLRRPQVEMLYGVFRQMEKYSNKNLKRNVDFLLAKLNKKADNISWVGASKQRFDSLMYKWHTGLLTNWSDWYTSRYTTFFRWNWFELLLFKYLPWYLVNYIQVFMCERYRKPSISLSKIPLVNLFT